MTTIELHGDRVGGRAVGKPRTAAVANLRDPAIAVPEARKLVQSGAWRSAPKTGDAGDKAEYLVRSKVPAALVVGRVAIEALTKNPPSPGCHWCAAAVCAALSLGEHPYPDHRSELVMKFLGNPCGRCRMRHASSDEIAASLKLYHDLVAEGVPPKVAAASRTRVDAYRAMAEIRKTEQATLPKAKPPAKVLHADGRRRAPDPKYYTGRPIRWPADAR